MKSLKSILKEVVDQKLIKEEEGLKGLYRLCKEKGYKERIEQFENEFIGLLMSEVEKSNLLDENELEDIAGGTGKFGKKFASAALSILGLASGFAPSMGAVNMSGTSAKQTAINAANGAKTWVTKNPGIAATIASGVGVPGLALVGAGVVQALKKDSSTAIKLQNWDKGKSIAFEGEIKEISEKLADLPKELKLVTQVEGQDDEDKPEGVQQYDEQSKNDLKEKIKELKKAIKESVNLKDFFTQAAGQSFEELNDAIEKFSKEDIETLNEQNEVEETADQIDFATYDKKDILKKWEAVLESSRKVLENNIELPGINDIIDAMSKSHAEVLNQLGEDSEVAAKQAEYDNIRELIKAKENERKDDSEEHHEESPDGVNNPEPQPSTVNTPNGTTDQGNQNSTFNDKVTVIEKYINVVKTNAQELKDSSNFNNIGNFADIENIQYTRGVEAFLGGAKEEIAQLDVSSEFATQNNAKTIRDNLEEKLNNAEKEFNAALNNFKLRYIQHKVNNDIIKPLQDLNEVSVLSHNNWESIGKVPGGKYNSLNQLNKNCVSCLNNVMFSNINFFSKIVEAKNLNTFIKKTTKQGTQFNWGKLNRIFENREDALKGKVKQIMDAANALFGDAIDEPKVLIDRKNLVEQALKEIMPK